MRDMFTRTSFAGDQVHNVFHFGETIQPQLKDATMRVHEGITEEVGYAYHRRISTMSNVGKH